MFNFKQIYDLGLMLWNSTTTVYDWFFTEQYIPEFQIFGNTFGDAYFVPIQLMLGVGLVVYLAFTLFKYIFK